MKGMGKDMWKSVWCTLFLFVCFTCIISSFAAQSSTITYQVHSYNDLREWPQILRKGTVYFKVDPHFMPGNFCISQPQVPQNPMGCFVLSHDGPVPEREYNSTYSILNFIADPQYAMYYKNPARRIYIALCFKLDTANPCDGSATAQNWTATTQLFFEAANDIVNDKGLNVEFILDGASTPTDSNFCLINMWRPWVATWIPGDSEAAPYSNNATFGLDRFQVFNPPAVAGVPGYFLDLWELQNYGKFSQGNYSYLIWEPSDQQPMLDISDSYLSGPIHELGLRFAINIDPVQLQVFTGTRSGTAWNNEIASSSKSSFISPSLVVIASPNSSSFYIVSTFVDSTTSETYYTVSTAPAWNNSQLGPVSTTQTNLLSVTNPINSLSILSLSSFSSSPSPTSTIFASQAGGGYTIFSFNATTQELSSVATGSLSSCILCKSVVVTTEDAAFVVQIISGNQSCGLQLQLWQIENYATADKVGNASCVQNNIDVRYYDVAFSGSAQGQSFCSADELPGILSFSDGSNNTYTSVLCLNPDTGAIQVNGGEGGGGVAVDIGTDTDVSLYTFNGQLTVLEVHSDGFCWNSEPNNKQPTPATCSNTPTSIEYVLNYNFGSFDDWATHVMNIINNKNRSYNLDDIFSSCHPTILHGAYDSGSSPRVSLFSANYASQEVLLHAEVHIGIPEGYNSTSQCGFAVPMEGAVVLDSWLLSSWVN